MTLSKDTLAGLFSLIFGVVYLMFTLNLDRATVGNPAAPLIFPSIIAGGMITMGICLLGSELIKKQHLEEKKEKTASEIYQRKLIIYTCICALIYAIFFEKLGYIVSTTFFMGASLFSLRGKDRWKSNILIALLFASFIYFTFVEGLGIPLPPLPIIGI